MSRGAVQPAVVSQQKLLRSIPAAVRQANVVQPATVTVQRVQVARPNPVR